MAQLVYKAMNEHEAEVRAGRPSPITAKRAEAQAVAECPRVDCAKCAKFLFRGALKGEIKCPRCGHMNRW